MKKAVFLFCFFALVFTAAMPVFASRIDILPRKILIDNRQRSAEITILNMGQTPNHVRVSLLSYRQKEDGTYEELTGPLDPAFDPEKMVRISPKQFTLATGARQKVRFTIQKPADLPDGEYRFHVKAMSFDEDNFSVRKTASKGSGMSISTNLAFVIPVIFREGDISGSVKIKNVTFVPASQSSHNQPSLKFDLVREGKAGVMGTIRALQTQSGAAEPVEIGIMSNMNVFAETPVRHVEMPLHSVPGAGPITLVYTNEFGDKGLLDEVTLQK